jgi:hypothetical protein
MELEITTDDDLFSLEAKLCTALTVARGDPILLRLARHLRADFFGESRVAALLATLNKHSELNVRDWRPTWIDTEIEENFRCSIVGLTAALYSKRLRSNRGDSFPDSREDLLSRIATQGGIVEPRSSGMRGSSISFCSFDPDWAEPAALAGTLNRPPLFKATFSKYRERYFEVGKGVSHTQTTRDADSLLTSFIYELYQNTFEHGRRDQTAKNIEGMRYVRIRKHIDTKEKFLSRTHNFEELKAYIERVVPDSSEFKFYEVVVSDHGLGMVEQFKSSRPDLPAHPDADLGWSGLINNLLTKPLTSKREVPGAGYGLQRVLFALEKLEGFISLRTGESWLCGFGAQRPGTFENIGLQNVSNRPKWCPIVGTHFNILLPVRVK